MRVFLVLVIKIKHFNIIWVALLEIQEKCSFSDSFLYSLYFLECVCMCVSARRDAEGCVCVSTTAYLFHPGHSANTHCKEPLVVIQAITQLQKRGRGETEGEITALGMKPDSLRFHSIIFPDTSAFWHVLPGACHSANRVMEEINKLFWESFDGIVTANLCHLLGQALYLHRKKSVPAIVA